MNWGKRGIVGAKSWFPAFALSFLTICNAAQAEKRVALVMGNSAYKNVTPLDNPKNDAALMAETLNSLGFTLVGGGAQLDLDKSGIDGAVRKFGDLLQGADVGLFYYAGHGVQVRGSNYLVPVDANPTRESNVDFQMLDTNVVLRQMEDAGTKLNIVILDACRNNPFGGRGLRATSRGLAQMQAPEGTLISFATQPGNVARDGDDGNSPYTKALAQAMRTPALDIFRTFNEVGVAVANVTGGSQQPWFALSPIKGDFYFTRAPATASGPPASSVIGAPAADEIFWLTIKDSDAMPLFDEFLRKFPASSHKAEARVRLEELKKDQLAVVAPLQPKSPPASIQATADAQVLKSEPPMGQLREGQTVLVDDGSCPKGQIKQVIGGNHVSVGGSKHILRTRRCIPRQRH